MSSRPVSSASQLLVGQSGSSLQEREGTSERGRSLSRPGWTLSPFGADATSAGARSYACAGQRRTPSARVHPAGWPRIEIRR
jgi:hypothetical protein